MRIVTTGHVGETRAAVIEGERAVELHLERWSDRGRHAVRGEVYRARVTGIDGSANGAFCDIGRGPTAFLPFGATGRPQRLHEGAAIGVQIAREAFQKKGPTLSLYEVKPGEAPDVIVSAPPIAKRLSIMYKAPVCAPGDVGIDLDALFEDALDSRAPIAGGGRLIIEPVTAMTVIDVDSAGRPSPGGAGKMALDLNKAAAREAARQIRLRGLGGVVAIDFLPLRKRSDQNQLDQTLKAAFRQDPAKVDVAPASRFAVVELARQRLGRALHEICWERFGVETVETLALTALRHLEAEGRADRSARLQLRTGKAIHAWLARDPIGWSKAMKARLGDRFTLMFDDSRPAHSFEVRPA